MGGEAVEGWVWARKVQVVGNFPLQHSEVVKMVSSNEQRAFAVQTYFTQSHSIIAVQSAFILPTKSPLGTEYQTKNPFCCGFRTSDGLFCSLPGTLHANKRPPFASQIILFVEFFTKTSTSILTRWFFFKNLHNRTGLNE